MNFSTSNMRMFAHNNCAYGRLLWVAIIWGCISKNFGMSGYWIYFWLYWLQEISLYYSILDKEEINLPKILISNKNIFAKKHTKTCKKTQICVIYFTRYFVIKCYNERDQSLTTYKGALGEQSPGVLCLITRDWSPDHCYWIWRDWSSSALEIGFPHVKGPARAKKLKKKNSTFSSFYLSYIDSHHTAHPFT